MNGTRFVVLLACLAVASVAIIIVGTPRSDGVPAAGEAPANPAAADRESVAEAGAARAGSATPPPIDTAIDSSVAATAEATADWDYRRTAVADLDGDAIPERLVLASDVFVTEDSEPMWEDAHRWAVYVEEDDGRRTLVYSAFVPLGAVSAAVSAAGAELAGASGSGESGARIVVVEQGPRRVRLLVVSYESPGRSRLLAATGADTRAWADRVAEEPR